MIKIRYVFTLLFIFFCTVSSAALQMSVGIGLPGSNIGINVSDYPELVIVPGYPVYYAPRMNSNYFFYDGLFWVYQGDNWYESSWYNGPWWLVDPEDVPLFVLRVPVRFYRRPPSFFLGWQSDASPRWGEHWGNRWNQQKIGWDRWNHHAMPERAPLPSYQKGYSGDHYPNEIEHQKEINQKNYGFSSGDPYVRKQNIRQQNHDQAKDTIQNGLPHQAPQPKQGRMEKQDRSMMNNETRPIRKSNENSQNQREPNVDRQNQDTRAIQRHEQIPIQKFGKPNEQNSGSDQDLKLGPNEGREKGRND